MAEHFELKISGLGKLLFLYHLVLSTGIGYSFRSSNNQITLNAPEHCGENNDTVYKVTPERGFNVGINATINFNCDKDYVSKFISSKEDVRLCIVQDGATNQIKDRNAKLRADGCQEEKTGYVCELKYYPDEWNWVEKCTTASELSLHLDKVNRYSDVDLNKVAIDLKVVSIESKERKQYLSGRYCFKSYELSNSQVSIFNRPKQEWGKRKQDVCGMEIKKTNNVDRSICLLYRPGSNFYCASNWTLSVLRTGYNLDAGNILYRLNCHDENATNKHSWCADKETRSVMLLYQLQPTASERAEMFEYILMDFNGTARDLLQSFSQEHKSDLGSESLGIGWIIAICFPVLLFAVVVVVLIRRRIKPLPPPDLPDPLHPLGAPVPLLSVDSDERKASEKLNSL